MVDDQVDGHSTSKSDWSLTREAWAKFLSCLDPDPERAGERYEALRLTLVKFFDWRGAFDPAACADETLNRVIRRIDEGESLRDIPSWSFGVARLVWLEMLKGPETRRTDFEEVEPLKLTAPAPAEEDPRQECFNRCLGELPPESRQLIMQYYRDERRAKIDNRLALAARLGIPLNALRSRAQRIRDRLEECVNRCLKKI